MSTEPDTVEHQIEMEKRAHAIRLQMLGNRRFQESLAAGIADDQADRMVPWEEVRQQLGLD